MPVAIDESGYAAVTQVQCSLDDLQDSANANGSEISFLREFLNDEIFQGLVKAQDRIENLPLASVDVSAARALAEVINVLNPLQATSKQATELKKILVTPNFQALLGTHDDVAQENYQDLPDQNHLSSPPPPVFQVMSDSVRLVSIRKSQNESLGITVKIEEETDDLVIARIMTGSLIEKQGLLDRPICTVNDRGYMSNARYSLQFPPNSFNQSKINKWRGKIPANAINVNVARHPINTITGVQFFTGLQNFPFREKAVPCVGLVPVTEAWRDELHSLTEALNLFPKEKPKEIKQEERPRTTQYSADTGRIIPPPSRAMSRKGSRQGHRQPLFDHIVAEPDMESYVMNMLAQILQTDKLSAVQSWLVSAGERERDQVMNIIQSALAGHDDYYRYDYPATYRDPDRPRTVLPALVESTNEPVDNAPMRVDNAPRRVDRLIVNDHGDDQNEPNIAAPQHVWSSIPQDTTENGMNDFKPPQTEAFKPRPSTRQGLSKTPKPATPGVQNNDIKLRYTRTPNTIGQQPTTNEWSQDKSITQ